MVQFSETFCWRLSKERGSYLIGFVELLIAIVLNLAIVEYYFFGDPGELTYQCHRRNEQYSSDLSPDNCAPAEINRTILYGLAFITFVCNCVNVFHPFSLYHSVKSEVAVILIPQLISGILKIICVFVYAVLSILFLPYRAIIAALLLFFEHYKIRRTLFFYIQFSDKHKVELIVRMRQDAERKFALLSNSDPPSYEESVARNVGSAVTTEFSGSRTESSTRIDVEPSSTLIPPGIAENTDSTSTIVESQTIGLNTPSSLTGTEAFSIVLVGSQTEQNTN